MSTHNICFHRGIRKISVFLVKKMCLIWSYGYLSLLTLAMLNKLMPRHFLIFSPLDYLIQVFDRNSHT